MPFFEDLHKIFQNTPQSNLCGPLSAKAFVHCKTQVQMLNISVKFEGLRHYFCCNKTRADFREPRRVYFFSCALEDATMLDILFKRSSWPIAGFIGALKFHFICLLFVRSTRLTILGAVCVSVWSWLQAVSLCSVSL